eukprot:7836154-Pyramimonas_sp.AAC.1
MWEATCSPHHRTARVQAAIPLPSVEAVQAISKSDSTKSAVSLDGFHCRHLSCLTGEGVQAFIYLLGISECLGQLPPQLQW